MASYPWNRKDQQSINFSKFWWHLSLSIMSWLCITDLIKKTPIDTKILSFLCISIQITKKHSLRSKIKQGLLIIYTEKIKLTVSSVLLQFFRLIFFKYTNFCRKCFRTYFVILYTKYCHFTKFCVLSCDCFLYSSSKWARFTVVQNDCTIQRSAWRHKRVSLWTSVLPPS